MKKSLYFIMSLSCILLYSCGKEQTDPNSAGQGGILPPNQEVGQAKPTVTGSVKTVTPKQVLLVCNVTIPDGIAQSEFGVAYTKTKGGDSAAAEKVKARKSEGNTFEVLLAHLDCGTEYFYYPYVKAGDTYYFSSEQSFKTEPLPDNAVDLHLSNDMLWATRNLGASSAEDAGDTYCWGETSPRVYDAQKREYKFGLYIDEEVSPVSYTKYTYDDGKKSERWYDANGKFIGDGRVFLDAEDDAATAALGGKWKTPGISDYEVLCTETESSAAPGANGAVTTFTNKGVSMKIRSDAHYWTSDLTDAGKQKMDLYPLLQEVSSANAYGILIQSSEKTSWSPDKGMVTTKTLSFFNNGRFVAYPIRPVYDCSIDDRAVSQPRDGYKTLTVEESPKIDPSELACLSKADGTWSIGIVNRRVYKEYKTGKSLISAESLGKDSKENFSISILCSAIENTAIGEDIDIQDVECGFPYSNMRTVREITGKIKLVSKDDMRVILDWEDVRFTISNGEYVINGKMSCILK